MRARLQEGTPPVSPNAQGACRLISLALACLVACALAFGHAGKAWAAPVDGEAPGAAEELPALTFGPDDLKTDGMPDSQTLFAGYVQRAFGADRQAFAQLCAQKTTRGSRLSGQEKIVYDKLGELICAMAAGQRSTAIVTIPLEELGVKASYRADELGLQSVFEPENPSVVSEEARQAVNSVFNVALLRILNAVLSDYPYELYWYDKTYGIVFSPPSISAFDNNEGGGIIFAAPCTASFKLYVSGDYSPEGVVGGFEADMALTGAASKAALAAQDIVEAHEADGDIDKLHAYLEAVARLTDYDYQAAETYDVTGVYGDPWQVIHVFDGDPATKVVCEGYSKAFQYLCDLSSFDDPDIACNSVSGEMFGGTGSGPHMWNVVHVNAKNYLVDITNNDNFPDEDAGSGAASASITPNDELFLAGATGSVWDGYRVEWPDASGGDSHWINYYYDDDLLYFFDEDELALSQTSYAQDVAGGDEPGPGDEPQPTDDELVAQVYALINAIGKVSLDERSAQAIAAARAAYDALTDEQKALVSNAFALSNAEACYAALQALVQDAGSDDNGSSTDAGTANEVKRVTSVTLNAKTVNAKAVKKAIASHGATVTTVVLGRKVARIAKGAFKAFPKVKTLVVKTKRLKVSKVKGCLTASKVKTVRVKVGNKKANKTYAKKYKKLFAKKVAGKRARVSS